MKGIAVAVLIIGQEGIPLVRDPEKPPPIFWKLPGGKGEHEESPECAASRELEEETGVVIPPQDLRPVFEEDRGSHTFFLYQGEILGPLGLKRAGDEGEKIGIFHPAEMMEMPGFFEPHRRMLHKLGIF